MRPDVLLARAEFIDGARPSVAYCHANRIDWIETAPATGGLYLAGIEVVSPGRFVFAEPGLEAVVIEAIGEDAETVLDLVAWPTNDPGQVLTMFGACPVLGEAASVNPTTYFLGAPLRLFRRPLEWMQERCAGVVLLDVPRAARWLRDVDARLAAEDEQHAAEIRKAMLASVDVSRIVVPRRHREAA